MSDDDYTPSTDEVREWYGELGVVTKRNGDLDRTDVPATLAEFGRWLASVEAAAEQRGAEKERERIAREAEKAWQDGSWALTRGTADWIRAEKGA